MATASIAYSAMNYYNGAWQNSYGADVTYFGVNSSAGGYMATSIRFVAPSYSGIPSTLSITVPIVGGWTNDGSMPCTYSLTSADPVGQGTVYLASTPGTDGDRIAMGTTTLTGLTNAVSYHTFTFSISELTSGGTYYLVLSANGTSYNSSVWMRASGSTTYSITGTLTYAYPASVPTLSASSVAMGSSVTIYTNREDSSYTHTITYTFGSATGTISSSVGASVSWTPPLTLASQIPSATSGVGSITCKTYSGSTLYGTKTISITLTVPSSVVPTIPDSGGFTATRVDNDVPSSWGIYVKGHSQATLTTTASGAYGSTIKSYSITGGLSGSSVTTAVLTTAGTNTWTVTVTDSRGRTATKSVSVTVYDYSTPTISGAKFERCDSDGTLNDDGTCIRATGTISISSCNSKNSYTAKVQYKLTTASTWTSAGTYTTSGTVQVFSVGLTDAVYDVRLLVTDAFQSVYAKSTLDTGNTIFEYDPDNDRMTVYPDLVLGSGTIRNTDNAVIRIVRIINDSTGCQPTDITNNWSSIPDGVFVIHNSSSAGGPVTAAAFGSKSGNYGSFVWLSYGGNCVCIYSNGVLTSKTWL